MASEKTPLCIKDDSFLGTITNELNGLIFETEEEYISHVITLYENNDLLKYYNKQARIQAEHCSSTSYAKKVLEVYNRAIKDKANENKFPLLSKLYKKIKGE